MRSVCLFLPAALFTAAVDPRRSSRKHRFTINPVRSPTDGSFALLLLDGENERAGPASDSKETKALTVRYFVSLYGISPDNVDKLLAKAISIAVAMRETMHVHNTRSDI